MLIKPTIRYYLNIMKLLLFLIAALNAAKLTHTLDNTQASFENQIADLLVHLNYDSKRLTKRNNQVTRPSNRRFGMYRKLSSQWGVRPNNSKHTLKQRRSMINSLVTNNRKTSKRNQMEKNRMMSSMFLV